MKFIGFLALCLVASYSNADLAGEECTDDVHIKEVQKTRFGEVNLVALDCLPPNAIMFHGQKVFEGIGFVSLDGYFRTKDTDVILVGSNPGGSATPDSPMAFLIIHSTSQVQVLTSPDFVADTPDTDKIKKWMDKNGRIFVNLGFRDGKQMVAELNSSNLTVHAFPKKHTPLADNYCHWLYEYGMENCKLVSVYEQDCAAHANPEELFTSVADGTELTYISNQPGYNRAGFNQFCMNRCNGKVISYQQFSKTTCGAR